MAERTEWLFERTEAVVPAGGGMVAAKTATAAEAGAAVLRDGGNAVDAAVAAAFAAGVAEPWMNGVGGGGFMVVQLPDQDPAVVEYPMVAPAGAEPDMFPLSGAPADTALFGWPSVVDQANIHGHRAVAIPGTVAGLSLALERFGTRSLAEMMAPAIQLAEEGVAVTWHTTLTIARDLGTLQRYPATADIFLDGARNPPVTIDQASPTMLKQLDLAGTLKTIAQEGPRAFYEGAIAQEIANYLAENDAPLSQRDLSAYEATVSSPVTARYRGHEILTVGGGSGGTSLIQAMMMLAELDIAQLEHNTPEALHMVAQVFRMAFADRFAYLADPAAIDVPLEALLSPEYARERAAMLSSNRMGSPMAGTRERLGVSHQLAPSVPEYTSGSTTHLSVIDGNGGAVSLTQTLLALWGSRVVVPGTGILLNNGMMWFDPEPGRPNSIAGGKRPLSNMAPVVVTKDGRTVASLGASGGRRIMNCNAQLVMNLLDHGLSMQPAISAPRIDASTRDLYVSSRIPETTTAALQALGHPIQRRVEGPGGAEFASPVGIERLANGELHGGADLFYPAMTISTGR
ncbi:MAG TPA: gamma-glutamyltransferase [Thermomicrobiales bacterium]|nr:gamma-glutamyltransferase [Thermomicrobiales bacterium]